MKKSAHQKSRGFRLWLLGLALAVVQIAKHIWLAIFHGPTVCLPEPVTDDVATTASSAPPPAPAAPTSSRPAAPPCWLAAVAYLCLKVTKETDVWLTIGLSDSTTRPDFSLLHFHVVFPLGENLSLGSVFTVATATQVKGVDDVYILLLEPAMPTSRKVKLILLRVDGEERVFVNDSDSGLFFSLPKKEAAGM